MIWSHLEEKTNLLQPHKSVEISWGEDWSPDFVERLKRSKSALWLLAATRTLGLLAV